MKELSITGTLHAFEHKHYCGQLWVPKVGDYYTIGRAAQRFVCVIDDINTRANRITTSFALSPDNSPSDWDLDRFLTEGFGTNRLHIPKWFLAQPIFFDFDPKELDIEIIS